MKNKLTRVVIITILATLLSYSIVQACSPVQLRILVKCSNLEVSLLEGLSQPIAGDTYEDTQERWINSTINNLRAIVPNCEENMAPVIPAFEQEIITWFEDETNKDAFLDGDLILEPYSSEREAVLSKSRGNVLSCSYTEYKKVGNWLIVLETSRPYCYTFWYAPGMCPSIILSLGHLLFYLATNLSITTIPYLAGLLLSGAVIMYGWWRFLKSRPIMKLWKMIVLSFVLLIAELFLIVMPVWLFIQLIAWFFLFGMLVLWYKYFKTSKDASKANAG